MHPFYTDVHESRCYHTHSSCTHCLIFVHKIKRPISYPMWSQIQETLVNRKDSIPLQLCMHCTTETSPCIAYKRKDTIYTYVTMPPSRDGNKMVAGCVSHFAKGSGWIHLWQACEAILVILRDTAVYSLLSNYLRSSKECYKVAHSHALAAPYSRNRKN